MKFRACIYREYVGPLMEIHGFSVNGNEVHVSIPIPIDLNQTDQSKNVVLESLTPISQIKNGLFVISTDEYKDHYFAADAQEVTSNATGLCHVLKFKYQRRIRTAYE